MNQFIQDIAIKAGKEVQKRFGKVTLAHVKGENAAEVVSEADLVSNEIILNSIKKKYPTHGIISEEAGEYNTDAEYVWVVDPLDGSRNFVSGTPLFAVMLCLMRNGVPELAAVYQPYTKQLLFAKKDEGAYLNGKRVYASQQKTWKGSWGFIACRSTPGNIRIIKNLLDHSVDQECWMTSLAGIGPSIMYLASGKRDWIAEMDAFAWDYAPSVLILKEAGYIVTNFKGTAWSLNDRGIVAANKDIYPVLFDLVKD